MYSHLIVGSNDLDKSKAFYDAVSGTMGGAAMMIEKVVGRNEFDSCHSLSAH
jgi:extradiol dioxygenase family protein